MVQDPRGSLWTRGMSDIEGARDRLGHQNLPGVGREGAGDSRKRPKVFGNSAMGPMLGGAS